MSASTFSVPLGSMPLRPTENIGCKSSIVETATGNVLAQSGINQRLAQRRSRGPDQDVLEDADAQISLGVWYLVDHPVDRRHRFPVATSQRPQQRSATIAVVRKSASEAPPWN